MADSPQSPLANAFRDPDTAPILYFDLAPTFGVLDGVLQVELAARAIAPAADGGTVARYVTVARLRCGPQAIENLRDAIDKALVMLRKPTGPVTASTVN